MPKARNVIKRDGKEPTKVFKRGGGVKKYDGENGSVVENTQAKERQPHEIESDKAWDTLRNLRGDVEDAQIMDRSQIPEATKKYNEAAPALRDIIDKIRGKHNYEPEGLPRTYKKGGSVNEAGNYTKPGLRKRIFNSVKAAAIVGTGAGQWSARKAQVMAKRYKAAGGGYKD
jgi:hypothetical protein